MSHPTPFYTRGFIPPSNQAAWTSMHKYDEVLREMELALGKELPDFMTLIAPEQAGKTTFAFYASAKLAGRSILPLYLDLQFLAGNSSESDFVRSLPSALDDSLSEAQQFISRDVRDDLIEFLNESKPTNFNELRRVLRSLCERLSEFDVVLLICDEIDALPQDLKSAFLRFLRAIYNTRMNSPLKRFSLMLLATTRPEQVHLGECSPFNVAAEFELPDLTPRELQEFLYRSQSFLEGREFSVDAMNYLYAVAGGHMSLVQEICLRTIEKSTNVVIEPNDIALGVADCFEARPKAVAHMLNIDSLPADSRNILKRLMIGEQILPFPSQGGAARLISRGAMQKSPNNHRYEFRSMLVKQMFISSYGQLNQVPVALTESEKLLLKFPQVQVVILDAQLELDVREVVGPEVLSLMAASDSPLRDNLSKLYEACLERITEFLQTRKPSLDEPGIRCFHTIYDPQAAEFPPASDAVYRLIAKVYAIWLLIELGIIETSEDQ